MGRCSLPLLAYEIVTHVSNQSSTGGESKSVQERHQRT